MVAASAGADPELIALDLLAQAEHGPDSPVWCISPDARAARRGRGRGRAARAERPSVADARRLVETRDAAAALALAEQIAPEHLELVGEEAEALADRVRNAGCLFVGAGVGHRVRRLRRRLEPCAAHGRRGAVPVGAVAGHVPAADGSRILAARGRRSSRARRRGTCASGGLSCARRVNGAPRVSRTSQIHRTTGETDVQLSLDLDGTGAGERSDRRRLLRPPARRGGSPRPGSTST